MNDLDHMLIAAELITKLQLENQTLRSLRNGQHKRCNQLLEQNCELEAYVKEQDNLIYLLQRDIDQERANALRSAPPTTQDSAPNIAAILQRGIDAAEKNPELIEQIYPFRLQTAYGTWRFKTEEDLEAAKQGMGIGPDIAPDNPDHYGLDRPRAKREDED